MKSRGKSSMSRNWHRILKEFKFKKLITVSTTNILKLIIVTRIKFKVCIFKPSTGLGKKICFHVCFYII